MSGAPLYFSDEGRWKRYVHAGNDASTTDIVLYRQHAGAERGAIDEASRTVPFVISTERRARDGDRIMVHGWRLSKFRQNPVIPWAHGRDPAVGMAPIGKALKVWREKNGNDEMELRAIKQFTTREENPFGGMVFDLIRGGYLNAASVAWNPIKVEPDRGLSEEDAKRYPYATIFREQDLLESSVVTVPADPDALVSARSFCDISPYKPIAERILDGDLDPHVLEPFFGSKSESIIQRVYQIVTSGDRFKADSTIVVPAPIVTERESTMQIDPSFVPAMLDDIKSIVREVVQEELRAFAPAPAPKTEPNTNPEPDSDPVVNFEIKPDVIRSAFLSAVGVENKQ